MTTINVEKAANLSEEIYEEFLKASSKFPAFASEHEGYAIILEEIDELWEVVKLNQKNPTRHNNCRKEVIQAGAMCLRFLYDRVPEYKP
jgi:hypothetical protein